MALNVPVRRGEELFDCRAEGARQVFSVGEQVGHRDLGKLSVRKGVGEGARELRRVA